MTTKTLKPPTCAGIRRGDYEMRPIFPGSIGTAAEIAEKLRIPNPVLKTVWVPPSTYELIAKKMDVGGEEYLERCKNWFDTHPTQVEHSSIVKPVYDETIVSKLYKQYQGKRPPIGEVIAAWKEAGASEVFIANILKSSKRAKDTEAKSVELFDSFWARYPSASKPVPTSKKIIRAVKKKV